MAKTKKHSQNIQSEKPSAQSRVNNALREKRKQAGISQSDLASDVGITRQALYAIETNRYLPSTPIALRLAQILQCSVEEIFCLSSSRQIVEAEWLGQSPVGEHSSRVRLSQVGERLMARPLDELGDVLNFILPADGIVEIQAGVKTKKKKVPVSLLHPLEEIQKGILIAGCDPAVFLAGEHVRHMHHLVGVTNWTMGSANALSALQRGEVHMAGMHLVDAQSNVGNVAYLKKHVRKKGFVGVNFAKWVQGLILRPGNSKRIKGISDLGKPNVRIINRESGSGARFLLDTLLQEAGLSATNIRGYEREVQSHLDVARLVRDGLVDAGIGVEAVARFYGLAFIPLREEQYDLIMREDLLKRHPSMEQFLDAMVSLPLRQEVEALGGYNLSDVGKMIRW